MLQPSFDYPGRFYTFYYDEPNNARNLSINESEDSYNVDNDKNQVAAANFMLVGVAHKGARCQRSAQSRTKRKMASTFLPVLAKQTMVSGVIRCWPAAASAHVGTGAAAVEADAGGVVDFERVAHADVSWGRPASAGEGGRCGLDTVCTRTRGRCKQKKPPRAGAVVERISCRLTSAVLA